MKVIVYTLEGCQHCLDLKNRLNKLSIPYIEREISKNRSEWESVVTQTKKDLLPSVYVGEDDVGNGVYYIPERDFQDLDSVVELIKNTI